MNDELGDETQHAEGQDEEAVFRTLQKRWLRSGPSGRQLLATLLRHEVFSRRDSPLRPQEGVGYLTNDQLRENPHDAEL